MSGISLTASMRSNLLSLQNISGQVSSTQNKLSTGNKVNSAIDNPSSYYTALSLNNRADDLNALLDSMGQAVSTIKAATTALESATEFLEQAKAVANQALETAKVPDKSFFETKVGENGAVVTTAQELRDAVAAGKETICVYGAIDLGDISTTGGLELKENQKLVGVGYFGNYDTDRFSLIKASANTNVQNLVTISKTGNLVSNLSIDYKSSLASTSGYAAINLNTRADATLQNLNIDTDFTAVQTRGIANFGGLLNIETNGSRASGIYFGQDGSCNVISNAQINIKTSGVNAVGIWAFIGSSINISSGANIHINSEAAASLYVEKDAVLDIEKGATIYAERGGAKVYSGTLNIAGNLYCEGQIATISTNCRINVDSTAQVYLNYNDGCFSIGNSITNPNILNIAQGAKIALEKDGTTKWYEVQSDYNYIASTTALNISQDNAETILDVASANEWKTAKDIWFEQEQKDSGKSNILQDLTDSGRNYQEIINQYDALIKDAGYKGINLLQQERLTVKFNEESTAALEVQGRDMSSKTLGFTTFEWESQGDINKSIEELSSAINTIRNYSSELGNNYNIITTRQDFTESLVNVLTEGADKLTLADMNEESANMLALQTRQQLAINSLSLASQASQSILKLF